jgi:hypothetical protein
LVGAFAPLCRALAAQSRTGNFKSCAREHLPICVHEKLGAVKAHKEKVNLPEREIENAPMRLGHVYNAKSAFAHVGDDFMKKQAAFDEAEIIGLNNEEIGITLGLRRPA